MRSPDVPAWAWSHGYSYRLRAGAKRHVLDKGCGASFLNSHGGTTSPLKVAVRLARRDKQRAACRTKVWLNPGYTLTVRLRKPVGISDRPDGLTSVLGVMRHGGGGSKVNNLLKGDIANFSNNTVCVGHIQG